MKKPQVLRISRTATEGNPVNKQLSRIVPFLMASNAICLATFISWDPSMGLPSDLDDESKRFASSGKLSYISLMEDGLWINETSPVDQFNFKKVDIEPFAEDDDWVFNLHAQVISHERPVLDFGLSAGVGTEDRLIRLVISTDRVGFSTGGSEYVLGQSVSLNLSDEPHLLQISKTGTVVSLFVDDAEFPYLEIDYSLFPAIAGTQIDLFQTSNPGIVQAFVDGFSFTSSDVHSVPEPRTNGLILPGFLSLFAVSFVTEKRKRMG